MPIFVLTVGILPLSLSGIGALRKRRDIKFFIIESDMMSESELTQAINSIDYAEVIGSASSLQLGLVSMAGRNPDIVLLNYEMITRNVQRALQEIRRINKDIEVILVSETKSTTAESSQKALELGAMYFIKKADGSKLQQNIKYYHRYLKPVIDLYRIGQPAK